MRSNPPINLIRAAKLRSVSVVWVLWLALSLLLSQSLGQWHAVKHGGVSAGAGAHAAHAHDGHGARASYAGLEAHEAGQAHHHHHDHGFLEALFSSHESASDCRLFDQLCDGQAMPVVVAAPLPIVLPSRLVAIFAGDALARWAALFDARGPPPAF